MYIKVIIGINHCGFLLRYPENLSRFFLVLPETSFRPERKSNNMIVSPIANAIPAVVPATISLSPPKMNVVSVVKKRTEPPDENPPRKEIMKRTM